jgi:hypothetical protein
MPLGHRKEPRIELLVSVNANLLGVTKTRLVLANLLNLALV